MGVLLTVFYHLPPLQLEAFVSAVAPIFESDERSINESTPTLLLAVEREDCNSTLECQLEMPQFERDQQAASLELALNVAPQLADSLIASSNGPLLKVFI